MNLRRQISANLGHGLDDIVVLLIGVYAIVEFNPYNSDAIHDDGFDIFDVFQLVDLFLYRVGHQFLHVQRAGSRVGNGDDDKWEIKLRVFRTRHGQVGQHTKNSQQCNNNQRELMVTDGIKRQFHESTLSCRRPRQQYCHHSGKAHPTG